MALLPYQSIVSSPVFTFLIGPDHTEYSIHSALAARQSNALDRLINGRMKEAIEKRVVWEDTDDETFICFSQYVYTGSYDEAEPQKRKLNPASPVDKVKDDVASSPPKPLNRRDSLELLDFLQYTRKDRLWYTFRTLHSRPAPTTSERVNAPEDDYTQIFLRHARIYVFADYHGIECLQFLALQKLRRALTTFQLYPVAFDDITQLVQYCFNKTVDKGKSSDSLRSLVCFYAACNMEDLWNSASFRGLLRTLPDFPEGLIGVLIKRLD